MVDGTGAPARVADLGCGTGSLALLLTEEGYDVTGVDFSDRSITLAQALSTELSIPANPVCMSALPRLHIRFGLLGPI